MIPENWIDAGVHGCELWFIAHPLSALRHILIILLLFIKKYNVIVFLFFLNKNDFWNLSILCWFWLYLKFIFFGWEIR